MDFRYPLLLIAKKEYLEELQHGNLYMVRCLYYQTIERNDEQRGDKYDGAIKCSYNGYNIPKDIRENTTNGRLMDLGAYIKCFFHCRENDVKQLPDSYLQFTISESSAKELQSFGEEYALIIHDVRKFIERFASACENDHRISHYYYDDVQYIEEGEYPNFEMDLINDALGKFSGNAVDPTFIKRKKYSPQQEFRIAVSLKLGDLPENLSDFIEFTMDGIEDISAIVKLNDLI